MIETNDYLQFLLVDFSKAFDTVNHFIIIEKLQKLDISHIVINLIIHILTDKTQQVVINGRRYSRLPITRSIVQGSVLRPLLFLSCILDLKPICKNNVMCKYADDLSQFCPQHSSSDLVDEFSHIVSWADVNKLIINSSKTKKIILKRPSWRRYIPPPPLMQIEQVEEAKLLGALLTPTLSIQSYVNYSISRPILSQRLYILNQLRTQGLNVSDLTGVFMALVVARFQSALPALTGQLSADDLHKVDAVFSNARR